MAEHGNFDEAGSNDRPFDSLPAGSSPSSATTPAARDTNPTMEAAALGGAMTTRQACADVVSMTTISDYHLPSHQVVFSAVHHLFNAGEPVDEVTVYDHLKATGTLETAGGPAAVSALLAACPAAPHAKVYAKKVAEYGRHRRIRAVLDQYASRSNDADVDDLVNDMVSEVSELTATNTPTSFTLEDTLAQSIDWLHDVETSDGMLGISTGLRDLDESLRGLQSGRLYVIAARPGVGKSLLAGTIAHQAILENKRVLMFSLEMPANEVGTRMLSADARVDKGRMESGALTPEDWNRIQKSSENLRGMGSFLIDDFGAQTQTTIRAATERFVAANDGVDLIVVDYLQLINETSDRTPREQHIAACSRMFKEMSKSYDCPVVLLSQLNRSSESRTDRRPMLSDLRESGAIEQDSDVVILLYRDEIYDPDTPDAGIIELIVAKNRQGRTGTVKAAFLGHISLIANLARSVPQSTSANVAEPSAAATPV